MLLQSSGAMIDHPLRIDPVSPYVALYYPSEVDSHCENVHQTTLDDRQPEYQNVPASTITKWRPGKYAILLYRKIVSSYPRPLSHDVLCQLDDDSIHDNLKMIELFTLQANELCFHPENLYSKSKCAELTEKMLSAREEFEKLRSTKGSTDPSTLMSSKMLAKCYLELKHFDEAENLLLEALKTLRCIGRNHVLQIIVMIDLLLVYEQQGNFEKVMSLHEEYYSTKQMLSAADAIMVEMIQGCSINSAVVSGLLGSDQQPSHEQSFASYRVSRVTFTKGVQQQVAVSDVDSVRSITSSQATSTQVSTRSRLRRSSDYESVRSSTRSREADRRQLQIHSIVVSGSSN